MSKRSRVPEPDDDVTEITDAEFEKVSGVGAPANRVPFILLKSREGTPPPRGMSALLRGGRVPVGARRRQQQVAVKAKSGRKISPAAREAFEENARRVKAGLKPKKKAKAAKAAFRSLMAQPSMAASAAPVRYGGEVPAMGAGEADAILRSVSGESGQTCGMRTGDGSPCQRPSVNGRPCHHHN